MTDVNITLRFKTDEYDVVVDDASTPNELCELFKAKLGERGDYRLIPLTSVHMTNGSIWELSEIPAESKLKRFKKK